MRSASIFSIAAVIVGVVGGPAAAGGPGGDELLGTGAYDRFEKPKACGSCHVDIYMQWQQSMMSQSYTHHWDEIEYFKLAVPHAKKDRHIR